MRIPSKSENLEGTVCVNSVGRIGVVAGVKEFSFGETWVGLGLDGEGTWRGARPAVVAESVWEFYDKLEDHFNGKMSYQG